MYLDRTLCGLTAIFAEELTRENVFDALRTRRCYATTGARILLDFHVNECAMGQIGRATDRVEIRVKVAGTAPIRSIAIVRNNVDIHRSEEPRMDMDQELIWRDHSPEPGSWYYARVTQSDGHMAWASPVWLD
jgi:hypothetical protein